MGAAGILILAGAVFAGIPPEELLTGSRPLAVMLLCTGLFRALRFPPSLDAAGLREALRFGAGILLSFAAGALFFAVTTMTEIRRFLEKSEALAAKPLEFFLRRPLPRRRRLSLALALMLGFLPRFFELWEGSETACRSRGCTGSLRRTILIVPLVAGRMIKLAGETAEALEARGLEV
jgi:biotin transport system permease protein